MSDKVKQAVAFFKDGFCCSQAVAAAFGPDYGLVQSIALKVSAGFGGGMARMADTCGAVTGAMMVIGMKYGSDQAQEKDAREKTNAIIQEFYRRFKQRNKTIICRDLLGFDMSTPQGKTLSRKEGAFDRCPYYVKDAAEILDELFQSIEVE